MQQGRKGKKGHRGARPAAAVVLRAFVSFVTFVSLVSLAAPASAELVFFNTGRTMSVKAHRVEGESVVLELRNGGEMAFASSLVERFTPDEVPYPEPEVAAEPVPAAPPVEVTPGPFSEIIDRVAAEQHVSAKLVRAVIQVES